MLLALLPYPLCSVFTVSCDLRKALIMCERQAGLNVIDTHLFESTSTFSRDQPYSDTLFRAPSTSPCKKSANNDCLLVSGMFNKLQGQPDSYDKKFVPSISK